MFQKDIAKLTADHLRIHIKSYLDEINALYENPATLVVPQVDTSSMAGGVMAVRLDKLPAYAVDCIGKAVAATSDNLIEFQYDGHIAGTISASSRDETDDIVKRHQAAVELFVQRHQFLHERATARLSTRFMIREMGFTSANFSGALLEKNEDNSETWLAGFILNMVWITSEDGPQDHK